MWHSSHNRYYQLKILCMYSSKKKLLSLNTCLIVSFLYFSFLFFFSFFNQMCMVLGRGMIEQFTTHNLESELPGLRFYSLTIYVSLCKRGIIVLLISWCYCAVVSFHSKYYKGPFFLFWETMMIGGLTWQ